MRAECLSPWLVEAAHLGQPMLCVVVAAHADAALAQQPVELVIALRREAVGGAGPGLESENLGEIDECVASHGEGELRLPGPVALHAGNEQGRSVEDGGKRGKPGLVGVLGAEVAEQREGDVGFEQLGGPALPLDEKGGKSLSRAGVDVPAQELGGGWRRAGARVEQGDGDFAAGEGAIEDGKVPHDDGEKPEAGAGLEDH